jgi:hypothetical protein
VKQNLALSNDKQTGHFLKKARKSEVVKNNFLKCILKIAMQGIKG